MVPHVAVISTKKTKALRDLLIKSSELFFVFLKETNVELPQTPAELTMVFVSSAQIRVHNKQYRNKDVPTDVLSFCAEEQERSGMGIVCNDNTTSYLGDILLCRDVIENNAMRFHVGFEEELIRVAVHGILHLLGFDHLGILGESDESIFKIQEDFIAKLNKEHFIK